MLTATVELLAERGTTGTGLNQVVAASGVSYGSIYNQFRDGKEALVAAAIEKAAGDVQLALGAVLDSAESLAAGCATMFDYGAALLASSDYRSGCPIGTAVGDGHTVPGVRAASAEAFAKWQGLVAARAVGFGATPVGAEEFASAVVSLYEGSLLVARATRSAAPIDAAKAAAVALAERTAP